MIRGKFRNLEGKIIIGKKEARRLKSSALSGIIDFSEGGQVPFTLVYSPSQKLWLDVYQIPPEVYFAEADKLIFVINSEFYHILCERGSFGDRFYASGKIEIEIKNHEIQNPKNL